MTNASILLVDDEVKLLETLKDDLTMEGYKVITASNGEDAIRIFTENPCDLVIMDIVMSGMDGLQVSREIKKLNPKTEVMIFTGYLTTSFAIDALRLGACDFIPKPCDNVDFTERVARGIKKAADNRRIDALLEKILLCDCCKRIRIDGDNTNFSWFESTFFHSEKTDLKLRHETCAKCLD